MIRNPNKTKSPTEKTKKPNRENKKAQVLSGAAYITASQRALNIFFSRNLLFANLPKRYGETKKSPSPIILYFYSKNEKLRSDKDNFMRKFHDWRTWMAGRSFLQIRLPVI